jgi:hypothetical protein
MPSQFRVEKIVGQEEWKSQYGPMVDWSMICRDLATDRSGPVSINAKPDNPYEVGQTFWAEHKGMRGGMAKLKRVQPPPGAASAPATVAGPSSAAPTHTRPYEKAVEVYKRMASDFDKEAGYPPEYATTLFIAWLGGKVADPEQQHEEDDSPEPQWSRTMIS